MKSLAPLMFFLVILASIPAFPGNDWAEGNLSEHFFDEKFKLFEDYSFDTKAKYQTDAVLIIRGGKLVFERYANGYKRSSKHRIWSVSKSLTALLVGIAVSEGRLKLEDLVSKYYPNVKKPYKNQLTVNHLMRMSSGLDWKEGYEANPLKSDVINMLYIDEHKDMASFTASRPFRTEPGKRFHYSSGETNLIMGILKKSMSQEEYDQYPWTRLFQPLQTGSVTWERDLSGTYVGSSYVFMRAVDLAKIGYLVLMNGLWGDRRILSEEFVRYLGVLAPAVNTTTLHGDDQNDSYGAQWWLNRELPLKKLSRNYKDAPEDLIMGSGHHGQGLYVFPTQKMVVVRYASDKNGRLDKNRFLGLLMGSLK